MNWLLERVGNIERVPMLICPASSYARWNGDREAPDTIVRLAGEVGPVWVGDRVVVPIEHEGGVFDIGLGDDGTVVVLQHYDLDDEPDDDEEVIHVARLRAALAAMEAPIRPCGALDVTDEIVVGSAMDRAETMARATTDPDARRCPLRIPLAPGRYTVFEGSTENEQWRVLRPATPTRSS
ncbi:MAG: hypothetical protein ABMB14_09520 [Myxococcota bacterium]